MSEPMIKLEVLVKEGSNIVIFKSGDQSWGIPLDRLEECLLPRNETQIINPSGRED